MAGVPGLIADTVTNPQALIAAGLGIVTIVLSFMWKKVPGPVRKVPAALVAVGIGIAVASLPGVEVKTLQVGNLLASVDVPGAEQLSGLADAGIITAILTFTVIASAESLFTAAAVDRMHNGPRTRYNTELIAQGAGNTIAACPRRAAHHGGRGAQLGERPGSTPRPASPVRCTASGCSPSRCCCRRCWR